MYPKERTAISSVNLHYLNEAEWLLSIDALINYSSSYCIINFNYAKYFGDFKKFKNFSIFKVLINYFFLDAIFQII